MVDKNVGFVCVMVFYVYSRWGRFGRGLFLLFNGYVFWKVGVFIGLFGILDGVVSFGF